MSIYYWASMLPDWKVLLAFFVIALAAFAAPPMGYHVARPHWFIRPLYFLVGILVVDFLLYYFSRPRTEDFVPDDEPIIRVLLLLRIVFFGVAMLMFIAGLQSLRRGDKSPLATDTDSSRAVGDQSNAAGPVESDAASPIREDR